MLSFLKKSAPQNEAILALDIGSDAVKAMVFTVEEKQGGGGEVVGKKALVHGFSKVSQHPENIQPGGMTDVARIIDNCRKAMGEASKQAKVNPGKLLMGIGGEFVRGGTALLTYKREDPESKINLTELRNIIHKLQWQAFGDIRRQVSDESGYAEIDTKLVNADIIDIRIDGYRVTNPLGFQGKEVKMSIFNSFAPSVHFEAMQSIAASFQMELLGVVSEPYALSRLMGEGERGGVSGIFIDVGGVNTDVVLVEDGAMVGNRMFAIGGRTFTKRMAVELNISFAEAEKLKIAYTEDKLEQKSKKIISDIIEADLELWLEGVVFTLAEFKKVKTLPPRIFLCGGASRLPEIKDTLNRRKWHKKLPFQTTPQATFLHASDAVDVIDETKKLSNHEDIIPLAMVNVAIGMTGTENIVQKALKKVTGIMKV